MTRIILAVVALALAGCATIITGTTKAVNVTSEPSGVIVSIQGKQVRTPGTILISRSSGNGVGYVRTEENGPVFPIMVQSEFEGWFIGNLVIGGVVGMLIDLATGAYRNYPDAVHFQLVGGTWQVGVPLHQAMRPVAPITSADVARLSSPPTPAAQSAHGRAALAELAGSSEVLLRAVSEPVPGWLERDGSLHDEGWTWTAEVRVVGRLAWEPLRFLWSATTGKTYWTRVNPTTPQTQSIGAYQIIE